MRRLAHILRLGVKELISLAHDTVVVVFIVYAFTVQIVVFSRGGSVELRHATLALVDEDHSPLSGRIRDAFREPDFQPAVTIDRRETDRVMDAGRFTFVVDVPPRFQADVLAGRRPTIQVLVDATAIAQAIIGAAYIRTAIGDEVTRYLSGEGAAAAAAGHDGPAVVMTVRVKYNPNRESRWLMGVMELAMTITMLGIVVPAAALLREREHGTIGRLLVMPLTPAEIVLAKVWASAAVVFVSTVVCLWAIVAGVLGVPVRGSIPLLLAGTLLFQLATAGLGVLLATFARTVPQLALLATVVMVPMMFLSGGWTPREAMPAALRLAMQLSPLTHYVDLLGAVVFRGAGLAVVWPSLVATAAIGAAFLGVALVRFRMTFTLARV